MNNKYRRCIVHLSFTHLVLFCSTILFESVTVLVAISTLLAGFSSLLRYRMAGELVSNRKLNADVIGARRNPMNHTVVADGKLEENKASAAHA